MGQRACFPQRWAQAPVAALAWKPRHQHGLDLVEHAGPIPRLFLAEQPHGRIPGAVVAIQQPAPVGDQGQRDPDGNSERACKVGDGRITGDHQVQIHHQGGRVGKILQAAPRFRDRKVITSLLQLLGARPFLQAKQVDIRQAGQRLEAAQREGAGTIVDVRRTAPPGNADLEAGDAAQFPPPVLYQVRVGEKVGDRCGYVAKDRVEDAGQAQQRSLKVEGRRLVSSSHQPIDARTTCQERQERRWAFDNHGSAALFDQGSVADELDRVSQPLLGMEEDGSSFQRLPVPERLRKVAPRPLFGLPTPFVLGPAALEIAGQQRQ